MTRPNDGESKYISLGLLPVKTQHLLAVLLPRVRIQADSFMEREFYLSEISATELFEALDIPDNADAREIMADVFNESKMFFLFFQGNNNHGTKCGYKIFTSFPKINGDKYIFEFSDPAFKLRTKILEGASVFGYREL